MSSEAAPTKDSAWEDFRALYLDYRQFVMIDARLMLDKTTPHPLAGVVGRVVVEPGRVVRLEIPRSWRRRQTPSEARPVSWAFAA